VKHRRLRGLAEQLFKEVQSAWDALKGPAMFIKF